MSVYTDLYYYTRALNDVQRARIQVQLRHGAAQESGLVVSTFALSESLDELKASERTLVKAIQDLMAETIYASWVGQSKGVGLLSVARLLGYTGDPILDGDGNPRSVGRLWAYCGMHVVNGHAPALRPGWQATWNVQARTRVRLIAENCRRTRCEGCRTGGVCTCATDGYKYRAIYARERAKWEERDVCLGHKDSHALRVVGKEVLKDMWRLGRAEVATTVGSV